MKIGQWLHALISRNFEGSGADGKPTGRITAERLDAIFSYAKGTTVESIGALHHAPRRLKFNLHFHPDPFEIDMRCADALSPRRDHRPSRSPCLFVHALLCQNLAGGWLRAIPLERDRAGALL
jgi:hypothetical protein